MTIQVTRYQKNDKLGPLVAFYSIIVPKWGNVYINDMKLFMKDGKRWIGFPNRSYESEGETKYFPYIGFADKDIFSKFQDQVLKAIEEYCAKSNEQPQPADEPLPF